MNIIVTGGAGYIGSHACNALAQAGYTPITYDNLAQGHQWAPAYGAWLSHPRASLATVK